MEVVDQICTQEREGRVLPTKLVFFMSAVITDLVVNVLPSPLPFAKSGEQVRCLWAQQTSAADQSEHLSKVYELSCIFTQISKQLPPRPLDRTAYASQCIVSTGLMAIFDALCRKKAVDNTLTVTTALRGRTDADSYQLSFSTFADVEFKALSANFLLEAPELARARSQLCEYIESTRSPNVILQLPPSPKEQFTFRLGKNDPTLGFWKVLVDRLDMSDSYPPSIQKPIEYYSEKMQSDDQRTREQAEEMMVQIGPGTWAEPQILTGWLVDDVYLKNSKCRLSWGKSDTRHTMSQLYQKCPEALQLRNMVWNHKIVLQRIDEQIWTKKMMVAPRNGGSLAESFIYRVGYAPCPCPTPEYCDLCVGAFDIGPTFDDGCLKFEPELVEPSPSDIGHKCYTDSVDAPQASRRYLDARGHEVNAAQLQRISSLSSASTEDDIVQCPVLPSWGGLLSQTDAELLLSFLTVPMIRAPLVADFFSTRVDMLFHPTMRDILESVMFEPGRWVPRRAQCHIDVVPAQSQDDLAEPHGVLMNELYTSAPAICQPLGTILRETLALPTGNYKCPHMELVLFVCRVAVHLQSYVQAALASDEVQPQSRNALVEFDELLSAFLNIKDAHMDESVIPTIAEWLQEAEADDHISAQAKLRAHLALSARNVLAGDMSLRRNHNALSCGLTFAHLTFTLKWHSFNFAEEQDGHDDVRLNGSLSVSDHMLFDLYQRMRPQLCACFVALDTASQKQALTQIMRAATRQRAATWGTEVDEMEEIEGPDLETVQALIGYGVSLADAKRAAKATRSARASLATRVNRALDWVAVPEHGDAEADSGGGAGLNVRQNLGLVVDTIYNRTFQLQTGILLAAGNQEMGPVPDSITMMDDYKERFGDVVVQCERAGAQTDTVQSVRLVGYPVELTKWEPFKPSGNRRGRVPIGFPEQLRPSPSPKYDGVLYSRSLGCLQDVRGHAQQMCREHERWFVEILDAVVSAEIKCTGESVFRHPWDVFLVEDELLPTAQTVSLLWRLTVEPQGGESQPPVWVECRVLRRGVLEVYNLVEHGRFTWPSLAYSSNSLLCWHDTIADVWKGEDDELKLPLPDCIQYHSGTGAIGSPKPAVSLVIEQQSSAGRLRRVKRSLLRGVLPAALVSNFSWWLNRQTGVVQGLIDSRKVAKDRNVSGWFDYAVQLEISRENRSGVLKRKARAVRRAAAEAGDDELQHTQSSAARSLMRLPSTVTHFDEPTEATRYLCDLLHASEDSLLGKLGSLLSRIENLGWVLCWCTLPDAEPNEQCQIAEIELPRLKLRFLPKLDANKKLRLYSAEFSDLYIADEEADTSHLSSALIDCVPFSLLLCNSQGDQFFLVPTYPVLRPTIKACPFTSRLVPDRGNVEWQLNCATRHFLYPIHASQSFVQFPSWASAVHFTMYALMRRDYVLATRLIDSCETDKDLSVEEQFVWKQLALTNEDGSDSHPDAVALRLKLSLALYYCPNTPPTWPIASELATYINKLSHVSRACKLSVQEEMLLMDAICHAEPPPEDHMLAVLSMRRRYLETNRGPDGPRRLSMPKADAQNGGESFRILQCNARHRLSNSTWEEQLKYMRPASRSPFDTAIDQLWRDDITGTVSNMGFCFLMELVHSPEKFSSFTEKTCRTLAAVGVRLLWLNKKEGDNVFPYQLIGALVSDVVRQIGTVGLPHLANQLERYSDRYAAGASTLDRMVTDRFCNTHQMDPDDRDSRCPAYRHPLPRGECPICNRSPQAAEAPPIEEELHKLASDCTEYISQVPPQAYVSASVTSVDRLTRREPTTLVVDLYRPSPHVRNFQNPHLRADHRTAEFAGRPLGKLAPNFVAEVPRVGEQVNDALPFSLDSHPACRSHVAKAMLARLKDSMPAYARRVAETVEKSMLQQGDQDVVRRCLDDLKRVREQDNECAMELARELVECANCCMKPNVAPDAQTETSLAYWLQRCAGIDCPITLHYALGAMMSADVEELRGVNALLCDADCVQVAQTALAFELRVNRVSQVQRCIGLCYKLIGELTKQRPDPRLVRSTDTMLAQSLSSRRAMQPLVEATLFDPRQITFEFINGWLLKPRQVDLVCDFIHKARAGKSSVQQMLMGEGKTTCIAPLLALNLADTKTLVTQVVPDSLLEQSRDVMWQCFSQIITKRILTLTFGRKSCSSRTEVDTLFGKLENARDTGGIVITTATAIKSLILKFIEVQRILSTSEPDLLRDLDCAAYSSGSAFSKRLKKRATELQASVEASDGLSRVLKMWKHGALLADEVDMLLHP